MAAVPSEGQAAAVRAPLAPADELTSRLYVRYRRQIFNFCLHNLGNREEAEDATQSTFLNAFRGLKRGTTPEFETAWLYKIAHNVCLNGRQSSSRRRSIEAAADFDTIQETVPSPQGDTDALFNLTKALEVMPEQQRRALLLREWQGLAYAEIANQMGLSQSAVETLLFRARRSLAQGLEAEPQQRKRGRPRSNDSGSLLAVLKSLFVGGATKIAATALTVAATSVVATAPPVRHSLVHVIAEATAMQTPVVHHVAPTPKPKAHIRTAVTPSAALAPSLHAAVTAAAPDKAGALHGMKHLPTVKPTASTTLHASGTRASTFAPAATTNAAASTAKTTAGGSPAAGAAAPPDPTAAAPAPSATDQSPTTPRPTSGTSDPSSTADAPSAGGSSDPPASTPTTGAAPAATAPTTAATTPSTVNATNKTTGTSSTTTTSGTTTTTTTAAPTSGSNSTGSNGTGPISIIYVPGSTATTTPAPTSPPPPTVTTVTVTPSPTTTTTTTTPAAPPTTTTMVTTVSVTPTPPSTMKPQTPTTTTTITTVSVTPSSS
jgi:RNA polymerase sigma factor (sigma-70 family)